MFTYEKYKKTNDIYTLENIIYQYLQYTKANLYDRTYCQNIVKDYIHKFNLEIPKFDINRILIPSSILRMKTISSAFFKIKSFSFHNQYL